MSICHKLHQVIELCTVLYSTVRGQAASTMEQDRASIKSNHLQFQVNEVFRIIHQLSTYFIVLCIVAVLCLPSQHASRDHTYLLAEGPSHQ